MFSIGEAARILGVCEKTLRRWEKSGKLVPWRTAGGHRRYTAGMIESVLTRPTPEEETPPEGESLGDNVNGNSISSKVDENLREGGPKQLPATKRPDRRIPMEGARSPHPYLYARVSTYNQKADGNLDRQRERLEKFVRETYGEDTDYTVIAEYGSGLNTRRRGLRRLVRAVKEGRVSTVVVMYRDRLTRFGFDYLASMFADYRVGITVVADNEDKTLYERMVEDMMAVLAVFSGRLYKSRALGLSEGERKKRRLEEAVAHAMEMDTKVKNFSAGLMYHNKIRGVISSGIPCF